MTAVTATPSEVFETVTRVVVWAESLMPEPGRGSEKLAVAKTILETLLQNLVMIWPMVSALIAALVAAYNSVGAFRKG